MKIPNIKFKTNDKQRELVVQIMGSGYDGYRGSYGMAFLNIRECLEYCTTADYFYKDWGNLEEIELLLERKTLFNSQQDVWEYLFSGGKVFKELNVYSVIDGKLISMNINTKEYTPVDLINFSDYNCWKPYNKSTEKEWWELNNNEPTLCRVTDIESYIDSSANVAIVYYFEGKYVQFDGLEWRYATPIPIEELKQFIFNPTK